MNPERLDKFERTASGAAIFDEVGKSTFHLTPPLTTSVLEDLLAAGLSLIARLGPDGAPLTVSASAPSPSEVAELVGLATNEREAAEIRAAVSSRDLVQLLADSIQDVEVQLIEPRWVRSADALHGAVARNWVEVAGAIGPLVTVRDLELALEQTGEPRPGAGALQCFVVPTVTAELELAARALRQVADAAAWTQVAHTVSVRDGTVFVTLLDSDAFVHEVTLDNAVGGVQLLRWLLATDDPNRHEALRYVLGIATLSGGGGLPDGRAVQKLSDRQRIALSQTRAAEVQRAISDSHKATTDALQSAADALSAALEDTMKSTTAAALAVLGVVVFIIKDSTGVPSLVVGGAALVALAGVLLVAVARSSLLGDRQRAVAQLVKRLDEDPLLPSAELTTVSERIGEFKLDERVRRARLGITAVTALTTVLVAGAAWWVIASPFENSTSSSTTTTVSTVTVPAPPSTATTVRTTTSTIAPSPGP